MKLLLHQAVRRQALSLPDGLWRAHYAIFRMIDSLFLWLILNIIGKYDRVFVKDDAGSEETLNDLRLHSSPTVDARHLHSNRQWSYSNGKRSILSSTYVYGRSRVVSMPEEGIAKAAFQVRILHIDEMPCNQQELLQFIPRHAQSVHNPCDLLNASI
jgi:hypothetical protein